MDETIRKLTEWLGAVLTEVPAEITAIYIECSEASNPGSNSLDVLTADAFGFRNLDLGPAFDFEDEMHLARLGDFDWESRGLMLDRTTHQTTDLVEDVVQAVNSPGIIALLPRREFRLLVGEHDGSVRVVR